MQYMSVSLPLRSNQGRNSQDGTARLLNCYAEDTGEDAKAPWTLYPSSGLDLWQTVAGTGGIRGMIATESYLYVVAGRTVTAIDVFDVKTVILTLPADGDVTLARNRRSPNPEVCLVANNLAYIIVNLTVTLITDADLPPPISVSVIDGYFMWPTTFDRVFISGEDNGTSVAPLDFGKAQKKPDQTMFALGGERDAMIFGLETIEWWTDSPDGSGNFPFTPIEAINLGCAGAKTIVQLDRATGWLANDGTVRLRDGYSGKRISTYAIERKMSGVDPLTISAFGWNEKDTGHAFLSWTCPTFTLVYDMRTDKWHERESAGRSNWRGSQSIVWRGRTLIGDYQDGRIYEVNASIPTEGGEEIRMCAVLPVVNTGASAFILDEISLDVLTGTGTAGPEVQDIDPKLMLTTSDDGGNTWGVERNLELGKSGERRRQLREYRFGQFLRQGCTIKLAISASVARSISGVDIRARAMR